MSSSPGLFSSLRRSLFFNPVAVVSTRGLKYFPPPIKYDDVEMESRARLPILPKVPTYPSNMKPPRMQKKLRLMRGPELVHNFLLHKQYGIMATCGGRLKHGHFEMIRLTLGRFLKPNEGRCFAIYRVDPPWQPLTKKGQGMRMGGGKGAIDEYATPIRAGRIIVEVAGKIEYAEVQRVLEDIAKKMPFKAIAVSQEILDQMRAEEECKERENINPWTFKYVAQNNLAGVHFWLRPIDHLHFGKYE